MEGLQYVLRTRLVSARLNTSRHAPYAHDMFHLVQQKPVPRFLRRLPWNRLKALV